MRMQRDTLGAKQIDEATDGGECVAGTDGDEDVIAVTGGHLGLGNFHECPGQVGCVYVSHCNYRVFAISHWRGCGGTEAVVWGAHSYEFPRTSHSRHAIACLDLNEYGADVGDSRDVQTFANLVAYTELHLAALQTCRWVLPPGASPPQGSVTAIAVRNRVGGR